jgi:hypothetical protein
MPVRAPVIPSAPSSTAQSNPINPEAQAPAPAAAAPTKKIRTAFAKSVDKLPDIYDLYDSDGFPISRASVQRFSVSQELRSKPQPPEGIRVQAEWRPEFGGYEIAAVL